MKLFPALPGSASCAPRSNSEFGKRRFPFLLPHSALRVPHCQSPLRAPHSAFRTSPNERGIALLFSLGILSMLLVLGLIFATNAMVDRKVAAGYNDSTAAKLLAQSAVQRAMIALKFSDATALATDDIRTNAGGGDTDEIADQFASLPGGLNIDTTAPQIEWQYVLNDSGKILGRIAYSFVGDDGLDPAACVKSLVDENGANEPRPGVDINEINVGSLDAAIPGATLTKMSYADAGGELTDGERWVDFDQFFGALGITIAADKEQFRKWFVISQASDAEGVWLDDGDGNQETGELYHRFNLARTDWDTPITVAQILDDASCNPPAVWTKVATHNGTCIPWLRTYANLPAETFSSPANRAKQIAANLIDYCDSNDVPTANPAPAAWAAGTTPDYTGNEKTPYINEVTAQVEASVVKSGGPGPGTFTYDYTVQIDIGAEVVNIYDDPLPSAGSCKVKLYGELEMQVHGQTETITLENTELDFGTVAAHSYDHKDLPIVLTIPLSIPLQDDALQDVVVKKLTLHTAIMSFPGPINVDYSTFYDNSDVITNQTLLASGAADATPEWVNCAWEVNDPRQNLFQADWTFHPAVLHQDFTTITTMTNPNTVATFAADGDAEAGSTVATISTGYIRNAPMQSPWELGCIHRGAKWETINLKKYNSTSGVKLADGIRTYADGDANILDQIKMTDKTEVFGKVNINISGDNYTDVLRALFQNIYVGETWAAPGGQTGSVVDATKADTIVDKVDTATGADGGAGTALISRAHMADVVELSDNSLGLGQTTDAQKEEIIGKVVNLLKTRAIGGNTLVVVAQTIKDVGDGANVVKEVFDTGTSAWVTQTVNNCQNGTYDQYADEIMATSKILAEVAMDPITRKWRIVRYEYLQE